MSVRFWLCSLASAGAALAGGLGLGFYAAIPPRTAGTGTVLLEGPVQQAGHEMALAGMNGPAIIHCKGCGPTLADRQMAADRAGWDGMNDPAVRDYAAQDDGPPPDYAEPPMPPIDRSVTGETGAGFDAVKVAQARNSKTSAGEAPADAAISY